MDLEGSEVVVPGATIKGPIYIYLGATKFLPILKEIFNKPPRDEKEEVEVCDLQVNWRQFILWLQEWWGRYLREIQTACGGGDVRQRIEEVEKDQVHVINYERHRRVTYVLTSAKQNLK